MHLATILRLNAASCLGFGLLFVVAPGGVAGILGSPPVWLVAALGAGLLGPDSALSGGAGKYSTSPAPAADQNPETHWYPVSIFTQ